jgi:hypothetical protein
MNNTVENLLCRGEQAIRRNGGVVGAELLEHRPANLGVVGVVVSREGQSDPRRIREQRVEVRLSARRDHPLGAEHEDEAPQLAVAVRERLGLEPLVGELVVPLMVQPAFPEVRHHVPIDAKVQGILLRLVNR